MLPWMIEKVKKEKPDEGGQIPLYLPLEAPRLTGSAEPAKEREEREPVVIDYSL